MKMPVLILMTVMAVTLPIASASAEDGANQPGKGQIDESAKKIKELQKERIATLKEIADHASTLFQIARVSYDEVIEAQLLVLEAELDIAEKESDRITLYKNMVDKFKQYEQFADARHQSGKGTMSSVLKAKARRLKVEIQLEQAKAKEAKESK